MTILGSCGETSETTAARMHGLIAVLYTVAAAALAGALVIEGIMILWHRASVTTHRRRAVERGE